MKLKTGRYYMVINDSLVDHWSTKYLTTYIRVIENGGGYAYAGTPKFVNAVSSSDYIIFSNENEIYYYKDRHYYGRAVDPNEFILIKLASIELDSIELY